jgi:multiple sugar transport system permease protein
VPEPYGRNTQHIYRFMSRPMQEALEMDLGGMTDAERAAAVKPLLTAAVAETNSKLLGRSSPEELRTKRAVGWVALVLLVVVFGTVIVSIWRSFGSLAVAPAGGVGGSRRWVPAAMVLPALGLMALWIYLPLGWSLGLSFTDYRLASESEYVGVMNFAEALFDPAFWLGLWRTLLFVALVVGLGFWPPVLLAILLDEVPTTGAKYFFRTLLYLPSIVSGVVVMFLWKQLYEPTPNGAINRLLLMLNELGSVSATLVKLIAIAMWLSLLGFSFLLARGLRDLDGAGKGFVLSLLSLTVAGTIGLISAMFDGGLDAVGGLVGPFNLEPLRFIESPQTAMLCSVLPLVWVAAGPACLLYLAALKTIPGDLYEAAEIDGSGFSTKLLHVTLPRIKLLLAINVIAAVVEAFKGGADFMLALTGGGPDGATTLLSLEIFTRTFMDLRFGLGTAMAWLLGLLLVGITAIQIRQIAKAQFTANT